ncbi:bcl-2-like protein 13 isoform X6 [Onychomys torridus]|uniref:bcl-2-like protein 13 isoform X6 n=1 Tax=Onychomys torridus TaxID=38674 RepID=UPI00167F574D|nr:bcl-2-like protein 13 isoform X6 [Onychomys torridus]
MASSTTVPLGFHYETKYVVLSYLGLLSQEKQEGPSPQDFGTPSFATANAFGIDTARSRAPECPATVWRDVSGGPCSGIHHSARWLGHCL